jgi:glutathione peroxidase-family protein
MGCVNYRCLSVYWHENVMYIFFCDKYQDILNYDVFQWNFKFEIFLVPKNTNVITFFTNANKRENINNGSIVFLNSVINLNFRW